MQRRWLAQSDAHIVLRAWPRVPQVTLSQAAIWDDMAHRIDEFAAIGGLSQAPCRANAQPLKLIATGNPADRAYEARFQANDADAFVAEALCNAAQVFSDRVVALQTVEVQAFDGAGPRRDRGLSALSDHLPFVWTDEREQFAGGFFIRVVVGQTAVDEAAAHAVEDAFGRWFTAVNLGLFSDFGLPAGPSHAHFDQESVVDGHEVLLSVGDYLMAEPDALEGLARALLWVHLNKVPLVSVDIHE